jgi:hypothetical protein
LEEREPLRAHPKFRYVLLHPLFLILVLTDDCIILESASEILMLALPRRTLRAVFHDLLASPRIYFIRIKVKEPRDFSRGVLELGFEYYHPRN